MSADGCTRAYRDLIVWQRAMDLVTTAYHLASRFPREEQYGLTSQVQRAAVSVAANIAEGQGRESAKAFINHLGIARGSLAELDTLLLIAVRIGYLDETELVEVSGQIPEVRRLLRGLMRSQEAKL